MPFQPGVSGNPGGRAKIKLADGRTITDLAREHTVIALEALLGVLRDKSAPAAARVTAAGIVIDRGWGKARQDMAIEVQQSRDIVAAIEAGTARVVALTASALITEHQAGD